MSLGVVDCTGLSKFVDARFRPFYVVLSLLLCFSSGCAVPLHVSICSSTVIILALLPW